ncbi:MAG: type II secretion system protein [Planctomycetes bacterium]|nr:type II secretion system protein [Planctomycetota bacterium]
MNRSPRSTGFTLIELVVVMGILSGFLVLLVQLVDTGLRLFQEGELGQLLADRTSRVQSVLTAELGQLRGSGTGRDRDTVDDRLVVQRLPLGLPPLAERDPTTVQVLRAAVHLPADRESVLRDALLAMRALEARPELSPAEVDQAVAAARPTEPLRGIGNLLLVPWRQEGADDALLELRAAWFLPDQKVPVGPERSVDPATVAVPGSADLPGLVVMQNTTVLLRDLLHVEFLLWSQTTTAWGSTPAAELGSGGSSPEAIWDSARGGWLVDAASGGAFAFDRGTWSAADPTDDVQPHAILVRAVVAQPDHVAAEGLLADGIDADDQGLVLVDGDRFPGPSDGGWIKLRGEWIRYGSRDGDVLRGLQRGQRGTKPRAHDAGVRVHVGRSVEFVVPVPHARDDWNG